jgi:hypothetical protein
MRNAMLLPICRLIDRCPGIFAVSLVALALALLRFAFSAVLTNFGVAALLLCIAAIFVFGLWWDRKFPISSDADRLSPPSTAVAPWRHIDPSAE